MESIKNMRFYITNIIGLGTSTEDPFYCPLTDTQGSVYDAIDGREYAEIEDGFLFAWTDNTDIEHAAALAHADITYLNTEDAGGNPILLDSPVSGITAVNRNAILATLESIGIPVDSVTGATTLRDVMGLVIKIIKYRGFLEKADLGTDLTLTLADIPPLKKKAIKRRLTNQGINVTGLTNTTTIRDAFNYLLTQLNVTTPF